MGGVVVRALASLQCGSTPGVHAICGLSLSVGSLPCSEIRGFSPGTQGEGGKRKGPRTTSDV